MSTGKNHAGREEVAALLAEHEGLPPLSPLVRRTERLRLYEAVETAVERQGEGTGVVFHRRDGEGWIAALRAADLLELLDGNSEGVEDQGETEGKGYVLVLEPSDAVTWSGVPPGRRLQRLVKAAKRSYGLRVARMRRTGGECSS